MPKLGVNIDHVATIRQARRGKEPDPVWAAMKAELGGADQITVHLREDRRHIQDRDLRLLKETVHVKLNLECACDDAMLATACETRPDRVCLVPEKREEVTTEGGLDVVGNLDRVASAVKTLHDAGIFVSLFIDPVEAQIEASKQLNVEAVELHTGTYANAETDEAQSSELITLENAGQHVLQRGLILHAGHGLNYHNVAAIADIEGMEELNIGHSIISRAVFVGLEEAVSEMKQLCIR
jgi:pyridoxine 5-phosphate synthase